MNGVKYDSNKPDYSLIPPAALNDAAKVLTFGAAKYDRDNWRKVEGGKDRYFAALQRHVWAVRSGEVNDEESGLSHYAHVIANAMFLYELYATDETQNDPLQTAREQLDATNHLREQPEVSSLWNADMFESWQST